MLNLHGISRESFDLIVEAEVSSQSVYEKKYRRPERPGGGSGITVGIGYDCGYATAATIRQDWGGKIPDAMVAALVGVAGKTGDKAEGMLASMRTKVDVPWSAAIEVFSNVSIPKYMAMARNGLPGYDNLPPACQGALLSLVYNRGASFTKAGARYSEMRAIRTAMQSGNLAEIPGLFRKMKRLWTTASVRGVALRRDREAELFEAGMSGGTAAVSTAPAAPIVQTAPVPIAMQQPGILSTLWTSFRGKDAVLATTPVKARPGLLPNGNTGLYDQQEMLSSKGYAEVGQPDGGMGTKTRNAIRAFRGENGLPDGEEINAEFIAALAAAGPRQLAKSRVEASASDLRSKGNSQVATLDSFNWVGKSIIGLALGGGVDQAGLLNKASDTLQSAQDTLGTVTTIATTIIGIAQWCFANWWMFALGGGIFIVFRVAMAVLNMVVMFRQGFLARADR